jgi:hypothetical protein
MPRLKDIFTPLHLRSAAWLAAFSMAVELAVCLFVWTPNPGFIRTVIGTIATLAGPFTGAIARYDEPVLQGQFWRPIGIWAAFVLVVLLCQVAPLPFRRGARAFRITTWTLGLFVWFFVGWASLIAATD